MNSKAMKFMLAMCLLLLIIIFIEWQLLSLSKNQFVGTKLSDNEYQNDEKELSAITLTKLPLDSYVNMVERPLFIQGRRRVASGEDGDGQKGSKIEDLTLVGIYSIKDRLVAAFSKQGAEKRFVKISTNDDIAGWIVKQVLVDKIILQKGGRQQTLLLRAPKEKAAKKKSIAKPKRLTHKRKKIKS